MPVHFAVQHNTYKTMFAADPRLNSELFLFRRAVAARGSAEPMAGPASRVRLGLNASGLRPVVCKWTKVYTCAGVRSCRARGGRQRAEPLGGAFHGSRR